jgi:hypothetical protein
LPSLVINGDAGNDTINFNGSITFAADASLDANLQNDTASPGTDAVNVAANAQLITSGAGTIEVRASKNVTVNSGGKVQTSGAGTLTIDGFGGTVTGGDPVPVDSAGVFVIADDVNGDGGVVTSTGTGANAGNIVINGTSGPAGAGAGQGIDVRFLLGVEQGGRFSFFVNVEGVTQSTMMMKPNAPHKLR